MVHIEHVHYTAWAERLEAALKLIYPRTLWLVQHQDEVIRLPPAPEVLRWFRVIAMTQDGGRSVTADVPFTLVVDEEAFALVVVALGWELERRLAAMVGEEREGRGGI